MTLINLTPHPVTIGGNQTIPPSGVTLRLEERVEQVGSLDGIPTYQVVRSAPQGALEALPGWNEGAIYIVPSMVAEALRHPRFFFPYPLVRDEQGRVVGAEGLGQPG